MWFTSHQKLSFLFELTTVSSLTRDALLNQSKSLMTTFSHVAFFAGNSSADERRPHRYTI